MTHDEPSIDYVPLRRSGTYSSQVAPRGLPAWLRMVVFSVATAAAVGQASYWLTLRFVGSAAVRGNASSSAIAMGSVAARRTSASAVDWRQHAADNDSTGATGPPVTDSPRPNAPLANQAQSAAAVSGTQLRPPMAVGAGAVSASRSRGLRHARGTADYAQAASKNPGKVEQGSGSTRETNSILSESDAAELAEHAAGTEPNRRDRTPPPSAADLESAPNQPPNVSATLASANVQAPATLSPATRSTELIAPASAREHATLLPAIRSTELIAPATLHITSVVLQGALPNAAIHRAIARVRPELATCFERGDSSHHGGMLSVQLQIDERGRVRKTQIEHTDSPVLANCLISILNRMVSVAPDTGTVSLTLSMEPNA
jgi:hypothetical protein